MIRAVRAGVIAILSLAFPPAVAEEAAPPGLALSPGGEARLVLAAWPEGGAWVVRQVEDVVEIGFPGLGRPIEIPGAFRDALGGRIVEITSEQHGEDTHLRVTLGCDCSLALRGGPGSRLLIDVHGEPVAPEEPAPRFAPVPMARGTSPVAAHPSGGIIDVEEARKHLMEQLLRAAEAGIVDIEPEEGAEPGEAAADASASPVAAERESPATDDGSSEANAPANGPATEHAANTEHAAPADAITDPDIIPHPVAGAVDGASDKEAITETPPGLEVPCHPPELFVFPDPDLGGGFAAQVAALRQRLLGEFDMPDATVPIELARLYLSVGFVAEARAVLTEFAIDHPQAAPIAEIAALIAGEALPAEASLRRADCVGDQSLWRAVAAALDGDGATALRDEIASGRALERLPSILRKEIAARLGEAAADAGDWDGARRMEAMADRTIAVPGSRRGPNLLLSARLAAWNGHSDTAFAHLNTARANDPQSAERATLALADAVLHGGAVSHRDFVTLQTDLGEIARLQIGSKAGADAFERALRLVEHVEGHDSAVELLSHGLARGLIDQDRYGALLSDIADGDPTGAASRPIALIYLEDPARFEPAMSKPSFRAALARSMIELGLPAQAAPLIAGTNLDDPDLSGDLAAAFLAVGDHREALEVISRLPESERKHRLMADALLAIGASDRATDHLAAAEPSGAGAADRLAAIAANMRAAIASGDTEAALAHALDRLDAAPGVGFAEEAAMLALQVGRTEIPAAVRTVLAKDAPMRLAGLELLFREPDPGPLAPDQAAVSAYIESLDAEISTIERLLNDG